MMALLYSDKFPITTDGRRILDWFIRSPFFEDWRESNLGNDLFISDPERAERIHDAAEHGCDGSTHSEVIEDWRSAWSDLLRSRTSWGSTDRVETAVGVAIDDVEAYHETFGSLHGVIG